MSKKPLCKLLLAATGSVAAMKMPALIQALLDLPPKARNTDFQMHLILTEKSKHFIKMAEMPKGVKIYDSVVQFKTWSQQGDPVLHVELGNIADLMVIAPLNANTMGKICSGVTNNLLTTTIRAWDMHKPLIFCPAMNTKMWFHPITAGQIATLKKWGYIEVPPIIKTLECKEVGIGGMATPEDIIKVILKITNKIFKK